MTTTNDNTRRDGVRSIDCSAISDEDLPLSTNRTRQQARDLLGEVLRHRQGLGSHGCVEVVNAIEVVDSLIAERNRLERENARLRACVVNARNAAQGIIDGGKPLAIAEALADHCDDVLPNMN